MTGRTYTRKEFLTKTKADLDKWEASNKANDKLTLDYSEWFESFLNSLKEDES